MAAHVFDDGWAVTGEGGGGCSGGCSGCVFGVWSSVGVPSVFVPAGEEIVLAGPVFDGPEPSATGSAGAVVDQRVLAVRIEPCVVAIVVPAAVVPLIVPEDVA